MQSNNYLILPGCDDTNRGDQALIWETVEIAKKAGYVGDFYMLADSEKAMQSADKGIYQFDYILPHPSTHFNNSDNIKYSLWLKLKWAISALLDMCYCAPLLSKNLRKILRIFYRKKTKKSLTYFEKSNVSFVKGGGFLHAYGGLAESYKIYYFLYHIRLALSYGHTVYVMPNSFGPFEGPFVKHMIKKTLSKCETVMCREVISQKQLLKCCGISSMCFPDLAFFLKNDSLFNAESKLKSIGVPLGEMPCVAITMRPYRFPGRDNSQELYSNYQNALAQFIVWLSKNGFFPVLVEHVSCQLEHENDMTCISEVIKKLEDECDFTVFSDNSLTCEQMKKIYSCFDFVVGTRFHSVIFSISEGVPSIAITYGGNKGQGIMKDLNLDVYSIAIDNISSPKLMETFELLYKNQIEIKSQLDKFSADIRLEEEKIIALLRKENNNADINRFHFDI